MANPSKFFRLLTLVVLLAGVLNSGCRGPQTPDPTMTAVRSGGGSGGMGGSDWISPEDVAAAEGLGLGMRDADMLGDGNRLEGLFSPIYFDFDQSFIRPADRGALQEVAQYLNDNTGSKLLVEGHCDWRGTTEYNMALGDRRANSVTTYLEQIGVSANLMETVSKGDLDSLTDASDQQMQLDRRAELIIIQ